MKELRTRLALCLLICISATHQADAKIWRVNIISDYVANNATKYGGNVGGTFANPVFPGLSEARVSALVKSGDTIHLEGCPPGRSYGTGSIFKKLIIIGAGYYLDENPNSSNDLFPSKLEGIVFDNGSDSSQLIGVWIISGDINIQVNNITVKRCKIDTYVTIQNDRSDLFFIANYFDNTDASTGSCLRVYTNTPANLVLKNNIFKKRVDLTEVTTGGKHIALVTECYNNIFDCPILAGKPSVILNSNSFKNNILKTPNATVQINAGNNTGLTYNTSASANQFGTAAGSNNTIASNISTLFASTGTSDGKYMLNLSSADNKPGDDGTERGAFGSSAVTNKYSISGLAAIPVIYDISTSGIADNTGLPVTIKAKTIK